MEESHVASLAHVFSCKVGKLFAKYLGLSFMFGTTKETSLGSGCRADEKKLSSWKGRYPSMGGRFTLTISVLSSIPIYFLSCFHCPKLVLQRIERIQRDFLWNDNVEKKKVSFGPMGECV